VFLVNKLTLFSKKSLAKQMCVERLLSARHIKMNNADRDLCPHGTGILVGEKRKKQKIRKDD
jgi:hypothetical protein